MNCYLVKLVFKISSTDPQSAVEFDEQYRILHASHDQEAFMKARFSGVKGETRFENTEGFTMHWSFVDVAFLKRIDPDEDGFELYSNTHHADHPEEYEQFVHHQAEHTYNNLIPHAVTLS